MLEDQDIIPSNQKKLRKMLAMILMLSGNKYYSRKEIAEKFQISQRTLYRYLNTFEEVGLFVYRDGEVVSLKLQESNLKKVSDLLHFSKEEAAILSKAIHCIDDNNVLKGNLIKKLYSLYDFNRVALSVLKKEQSENVHTLLEAIQRNKQVVLCNYSSAHGNDTRDRLVEPFEFTANYITVWCYDCESKNNKQFKTSRMQKIKICDTNWHYPEKHQITPTDPFRMSGNSLKPIKLRISKRAAHLMQEEYPLSEPYLQPIQGNCYLFECNVCNYEGIGRFTLGLPGEIEILDTPEFMTFLDEKMKKFNVLDTFE